MSKTAQKGNSYGIEINGLDQDPHDPDPFNIFSHPSWHPLIELARDESDRIVGRSVPLINGSGDPVEALTQRKTWYDDQGRRIQSITVQAADRILTRRTRRDPDVDTVWTTEHLLKDVDDLKAYLALPVPEFSGVPDTSEFLATETALGDTGIVLIDTPDPLCLARQPGKSQIAAA